MTISDSIFKKVSRLASNRTKRWDGKVNNLPVEYLKGVQEKMKDYGDRVQFSLCSGPLPSYQLINSFDKKMAFDRNHHLLRAQEEEFSAANATAVFSMDDIDAMARGLRRVEEKKPRSVRVVRTTNSGTRVTVGKLEDQFATERYEYFRANRATLPPTITEHTDEIAALMKQGKSAEEAFGAIIQQHYKT